MKTICKHDNTRERLLDQADILFSQKGFYAVSVREITQAAACNLSAVNYHFGNKTGLYVEVFRQRWVERAKRIQGHFRRNLSKNAGSNLKNVVRALAEAFIEGPLSDDERQRHVQLMVRELARPTPAFQVVTQETTVPFVGEIANHLRPHLPPDLDEERLKLHVLSIFALIVYFNFSRNLISHIAGRPYDAQFKRQLVDHIADFCLKAMTCPEVQT